jgi:hypothetical protein
MIGAVDISGTVDEINCFFFSHFELRICNYVGNMVFLIWAEFHLNGMDSILRENLWTGLTGLYGFFVGLLSRRK